MGYLAAVAAAVARAVGAVVATAVAAVVGAVVGAAVATDVGTAGATPLFGIPGMAIIFAPDGSVTLTASPIFVILTNKWIVPVVGLPSGPSLTLTLMSTP